MNHDIQACSGCGVAIILRDGFAIERASEFRHTVEDCLRRQLVARTAERDAAVAEVEQRNKFDEAELEGAAAALDGKGADACPYPDEYLRSAWLCGHEDQLAELAIKAETARFKALIRDMCGPEGSPSRASAWYAAQEMVHSAQPGDGEKASKP